MQTITNTNKTKLLSALNIGKTKLSIILH